MKNKSRPKAAFISYSQFNSVNLQQPSTCVGEALDIAYSLM